MKKYPKYKDSGVEWIGDIPEKWDVIKMKYLGTPIIGLTYSPEDITDEDQGGMLVLRSSNIQNGKLLLEDNVFVKTKVQSELLVREGDILICTRNGSRNLIGKNIVIDKQVEGNTFGAFMTVFRTPNWRFISYVLNSSVFSEQSGLYLTATINQLTQSVLNGMLIPFVKDFIEQEAIAKFLDTKTSQIDQLISNSQNKINLLKEKRTALINHAVTKGLDPKAKMKDSGMEWIGEIPERWNLKKLKSIAFIVNGATPKSGVPEFWDGEIVWVTPSGISRLESRFIGDSERKITEEGFNSCGTRITPKGSIILTTRAPIGNVAISNEELCTNQGCKSISPIQVNSIFLYYFISTAKEVLQSLGSGTTFLELSSESLRSFVIVIPSKADQEEIVKYLDHHTSEIDKEVSLEERRIELLKEYRQSLISEVVTGKINVLDYAD